MLFSHVAGLLTGIALAPFFSWGVWQEEINARMETRPAMKKKSRMERLFEHAWRLGSEHLIEFHFRDLHCQCCDNQQERDYRQDGAKE
jgi:hypothetical protein